VTSRLLCVVQSVPPLEQDFTEFYGKGKPQHAPHIGVSLTLDVNASTLEKLVGRTKFNY